MRISIDKGILIGIGILFAACFIAPLHSQAAIAGKQGTSTASLVGWWKFDDGTSTTATDFSGNGNSGALSGSVGLPTWVAGKRGSALFFAGQDTNNNQTVAVSMTANPELVLTGDMTISAWIQPSSTFFDTSEVAVRAGQGSDLDYSIFFDEPNQRVSFQWYDGTFKSVASTNNSVPFNKWTHVTIVRTGTTVSFYINGVFNSSSAVTAPTVAGTQLTIGRTNNVAVPQDFSGAIDDVRIYNKPLTATDAANLYKAGEVVVKTANKSLLAGWWPLDEGTSTTAGDVSGLGSTGTFSGTALWAGGKRGRAASFTGSNFIVLSSASKASFSGTQPFTVSAWAYGNPQNRGTILSTASFTAGGYALAVGLNSPTAAGSDVDFFVENSPSGNVGALAPTNSFATSTWTHLVGVFDGNVVKVYVNGVLKNTSPGGTTIGANPNALRIGGATQGGWNNFTGLIDDVRVYNVALTDAQIMALYKENETKVNAPQNTRYTNGLVGYWTFNGPDVNTVVADVTGNGFNGYWIGSATSTALVPGKSGQGFTFNGGNNIVQLGTTDMGITSAFTASAWIKTTSLTSFMGIFSKDDSVNRSWKLGFSGTSGQIRFDVFNATTNSSAISSRIVTDGEWHLITATYDGNLSTLYIDGAQDGSIPALSGGVRSSTAIVKIGNDGCCSGRFFQGPIDEVRLL